MGDSSCCEREPGMAESGWAYERSRAATVVAETEPFFRDVMEVYVDLLCRGERDASRLLFRSGVRFAAAVHGLHRAAGRVSAANESAVCDGPAARSADAARRHLERCLFALWSAQPRESQQREAQQRGIDTSPLFERGLVMLSALRGMSADSAAESAAAEPAEPAAHALAARTRRESPPGR